MSAVQRALTQDRRRILYAFVAAALLFVIGQIIRPGFASAGAVMQILVIASFVGLVAAGQTFVILTGGIDLSVPWVLNAAAILLATSSLGRDGRLGYALAVTLGMGLLVGMVNGVAVAFFKVPPVVMTLGMNGIMQGLTLGLSRGMTCGSCSSGAPPALQELVRGRVLGIPGELYLWLIVIIAVSVVLSMTTFGRRIYALGNSETVSYLAGVPVQRMTVALYMLSGLFAALAGILLVGFGGQANLGMGDPFLFQSIAAVVIGGVYILGGRGHYLGVVAGAITLVTLIAVLNSSGMPQYGRTIVYGVVILLILLLYGREEREA